MALDDAADDVGQIDLRLDIVQLTGLDQRGQPRPVLGAPVGPREEVVLAPERQGPDGASTTLESSSMRPSSRKRVRPSQRASA